MSALNFIKSDDTSDIVFADAQAAEGNDAVARGVFTIPVVPKASTRRSAHRLLRSAPQSTSSDPVELSDDIEVSEGQDVDVEKEKKLVVHGKKKASTKKVAMISKIQMFMLTCWLTLLTLASAVLSEMESDHFISRLMLSSCNLSTLVAEGVTRFLKGMQGFEEFSKKKKKMNSLMAAIKKEIDGFSKKEEAWVKKVGELTRRHELEMNDLKKGFKADQLKLKVDREALNVQQKAFDEE
ncbi:hypothetical protein Hanom_Chr06g00553781 [Helianthus anomalus]